MNFSMLWPAALVVLSNTVYHISSKSTPDDIHPMAALTVTYAVSSVFSLVLYFYMNKGGSLQSEMQHLNWSSFLLGLAIVGLEAGFLYMYKAGWPVSSAQIVTSAVLGVVLICVGMLFFKESISLSKAAGILVCLVGLYLINR